MLFFLTFSESAHKSSLKNRAYVIEHIVVGRVNEVLICSKGMLLLVFYVFSLACTKLKYENPLRNLKTLRALVLYRKELALYHAELQLDRRETENPEAKFNCTRNKSIPPRDFGFREEMGVSAYNFCKNSLFDSRYF